jgi:hypothetical protein
MHSAVSTTAGSSAMPSLFLVSPRQMVDILIGPESGRFREIAIILAIASKPSAPQQRIGKSGNSFGHPTACRTALCHVRWANGCPQVREFGNGTIMRRRMRLSSLMAAWCGATVGVFLMAPLPRELLAVIFNMPASGRSLVAFLPVLSLPLSV